MITTNDTPESLAGFDRPTGSATVIDRGAAPVVTTTPVAATTTSTHIDHHSLTELLSGIVSDAQRLISQQGAMLRAEMKDDISRALDAAKYLGSGAAVAIVGVLFVAVSLVHLLAWAVPDLPYWAAWMICGAAFLAIGVGLFFAGKRLFEKNNPLPDRSLDALKENVSWISNPRK